MNKFLEACKSAHNIGYIFSSSGFTLEGNISPSNIVVFDDYLNLGNITIDKNVRVEETTEFEGDIIRSWTFYRDESELTLLIA